MEHQLNLGIQDKVAYKPYNFMWHLGVSSLLFQVTDVLLEERFQICFINGGKSSGKSHLMVVLVEELQKRGAEPIYLNGETLTSFLDDQFADLSVSSKSVFVVDDLDLYLNATAAINSGQFVNFVERLRNESAKLVFTSSLSISELTCDEHVRSRLLPGVGYTIGNPACEEMDILIKQMGHQRGLSLSDRHIDFLSKRLPKSVSECCNFFDRALLYSKLTGRPVKFPFISEIL